MEMQPVVSHWASHSAANAYANAPYYSSMNMQDYISSPIHVASSQHHHHPHIHQPSHSTHHQQLSSQHLSQINAQHHISALGVQQRANQGFIQANEAMQVEYPYATAWR